MKIAPQIRGWSSYTVLGFTGYAVSTIVTVVLAHALQLGIGERMTVAFTSPLAFLAVVRFATWRAGYERIVFYQCATACVLVSAAVAALAGGRVGAVVDVTTIGIFVFLVFGRIGCFLVACCHGRPARCGVRYGRAHVVRGLSRRLQDRPLFPTQLVEAGASAALVVTGVVVLGHRADGTVAATLTSAYAVLRFGFELVRGDPDRRIRYGLSEAQRMAVLTSVIALVARPSIFGSVALGITMVGAGVLIATRRRPSRLLLRPAHLDAVYAQQQALAVSASAQTELGLAISKHTLPDGRTAFVWSRPDGLPLDVARRMRDGVVPDAEVVPGRSKDLVHVLVPRR